jgi:hypothetical protein
MTLSPNEWPRAVATLYRTFGARGLRMRAIHEIRRATGRFRRSPRLTARGSLPDPNPFFVDRGLLAAATNKEVAVDRANRVAGGEYQAFRHEWRRLPGNARDWLRHPRTDQIWDADRPWWRVEHLHPGRGDIKELWEPARCAWAYDLVRGWLLTGNDRYARSFHENLARWLEASPPFVGPHWSCGQETAIRAAALLYAEANLNGAPSSTPAAMDRIVQVLAASGERISDAIGYAISQRNNHAISEATGLTLLGARLHGAHPEAGRWLDRGQRYLEVLVREQLAPDGWYIQHSFTYQRLALDQLVLAERALRSVGRELSGKAVALVRASADLLMALVDAGTGRVPNHGANDGAFVQPITLADYRDFRPVMTAVAVLWRYGLPADIPPDPETAAWLGAADVAQAPARVDEVRTGASGWAVARVGGTRVFLRAGRYRSRPGHLDPMHLDILINGEEVVVDPGTFAYTAPPPWNNGLATARVHNGPIVDGVEPGVRGPRFLWLAWPEAAIVSTEFSEGSAVLVAELGGRARRTVWVVPGVVRIEDEALDPEGSKNLAVVWTLHPDAPLEAVSVTAPVVVAPAEPDGVRGWFSPHYGERVATRFVEAIVRGGTPLVTTVTRAEAGPGPGGETHE